MSGHSAPSFLWPPLLQTPAVTANEAPIQSLIGLAWAELRLGCLGALSSVTSSYVMRVEGGRMGLLSAHFQGGTQPTFL